MFPNSPSELKLNFLCLLTIIVNLSAIKCKSVPPPVPSNDNKWVPIRNFRSPLQLAPTGNATFGFSSPMMAAESVNIGFQTNQNENIPKHNKEPPACIQKFHDQLMQILSSQDGEQFLQKLKQHSTSASNQTPVNVINRIVSRHSRDLKENNLNDIGNDEDENDPGDEDSEGGDSEQPEVANLPKTASASDSLRYPGNSNFELNNSPSSTNKLQNSFDLPHQPNGVRDLIEAPTPTSEEAPSDEAQMRKEQEAIESSEAEAADRSALDEQQQQQREIIQAQAEHEARAIKEQQELLLKQQRLQQQMIFLRDRNDLKANHSLAQPYGSLVDRQNLRRLQSNKKITGRHSTDIQFSDLPNYGLDKASSDDQSRRGYSLDLKSQPELIQEENRPKLSSSLTLMFPAEAIHHNYGSHYGSLHKHQNHYYQYAESHKKGQFKSGYKRGGKKFKISGHSSQHKNHAEGHVKWKGKKGKGLSFWNLNHSGKAKKHHHYHHY